jgi:hypothetical protein
MLNYIILLAIAIIIIYLVYNEINTIKNDINKKIKQEINTIEKRLSTNENKIETELRTATIKLKQTNTEMLDQIRTMDDLERQNIVVSDNFVEDEMSGDNNNMMYLSEIANCQKEELYMSSPERIYDEHKNVLPSAQLTTNNQNSIDESSDASSDTHEIDNKQTELLKLVNDSENIVSRYDNDSIIELGQNNDEEKVIDEVDDEDNDEDNDEEKVIDEVDDEDNDEDNDVASDVVDDEVVDEVDDVVDDEVDDVVDDVVSDEVDDVVSDEVDGEDNDEVGDVVSDEVDGEDNDEVDGEDNDEVGDVVSDEVGSVSEDNITDEIGIVDNISEDNINELGKISSYGIDELQLMAKKLNIDINNKKKRVLYNQIKEKNSHV